MKFFLVALVFLLSLGQLQRIQLTNNIAIYLHDLLIVGFLLKELFSVFLQRKKIIENSKKIKIFPKKILLILILSICISWAMAFFRKEFDFRAILYLIRLLSYIAFVFLLQKKLTNKNWLWRLVSFNILMLGFIQYIFLPDLRFMIYDGYDDHFYRLTSTILDPAFTGLIFVFNLNYYLWQKKKNYLLITLFVIGLLLTYSRSSYLAFLISNLLISILQKANKKFIILVTIIFLTSLPFLPKQSGGDGVNLLRTNSTQARVNNDQKILQNINGLEWVFGQGLFVPIQKENNNNIPVHSHFADNIFVFLVSNLGILGSFLLCILLWQSVKKSKKENLIFTSSLLTHAIFNNNLTQSFVVLIFLGFYLTKD